MAGSSSSAGLFENHEIPISISNIGGVGEHESSAGLGPAADDVLLVLSAVGCNSNSNGAPSSGGSMVGPTTTAGAGAGGASQNQKKRRNVPGIGNPDAEVIALSPKSLMATNRFICEVCNKGFQREQNLQLHRRGHNLPWKLKQKSSNKDGAPVRKKVYLCPESSCVHHDPSRALGDLTGIKKHFYRKHGEKKFKCDKCSKKYAVQSDWKAHRKTCGTREYRCDCGTVFSRRDSFVTHRAFCDVITREALNHPTTLTAINGGSLFPPSTAATASMGLGLSQQLHHNLPSSSSSSSLPLQIQSHQNPNNDHLLLNPNVDGSRSKFDHLLHSHMGSALYPMTTTTNIYNPTSQNGYATQLHHHHHQLGLQMQPTEHTAAAGGYCGTTLFSSNNINGFFSPPSSHIFQGDETAPNLFSPPNNIIAGTSGFTSLFPTTSGNIHQQPADITTTTPHMSATALLQKAAQIGSTSSNQHPNSILKSSPASHSTTNKPPPPPSTYGTTTLFDPSTCTDNIQEFINTLNGGTIFSSTATSSSNIRFGMGMGMPESDRLTRDFLGVGEQQHQGIDFIMARGTAGLHNTPTPTHTNNISNAPPPAGHHNFDRDH